MSRATEAGVLMDLSAFMFPAFFKNDSTKRQHHKCRVSATFQPGSVKCACTLTAIVENTFSSSQHLWAFPGSYRWHSAIYRDLNTNKNWSQWWMRNMDLYENMLLAGMSQTGGDISLKGGAGLLPSPSTIKGQLGKQREHCVELFVQQVWCCRLGKWNLVPPRSISLCFLHWGWE